MRFVALLLLVFVQCSFFDMCVSSHADDFLDNLKNFGIHIERLSQRCLEQIKGLDDYTLYKMFDASSKVPSGRLEGNLFDLGIFDECYEVEAKSNSENITGKFCLGAKNKNSQLSTQLPLKNVSKYFGVRMLPIDISPMAFHSSICVPNGCSAAELTSSSLTFTFSEENCYSKDTRPEIDSGGIAAITLLVIFGITTVLSTLIDSLIRFDLLKTVKFGRTLSRKAEVLSAFSILSNGNKLISSTTNADQLLCLNGIKAISMMWVIFGHEYFYSLYSPISNFLDLIDWMRSFDNMFVLGETVSVDSFLLVGGLVTVYVFMRTMDRSSNFNLFLFYLHRYIRLTPALAIVILINATLAKHLGNGPMWSFVDSFMGDNCRKYWWSSLLYIQNYVNVNATCISPTWYLSVDMQLFVLSPLILLPLRKWKNFTLYGLHALSIAGIVIPFGIAFAFKLDAFYGLDDTNEYRAVYYNQTFARFGPYVIGMIFGNLVYEMRKTGKKLRLNLISVLSAWSAIIGVLLVCLYGLYGLSNGEYNRWTHSLFISVHRSAWAVALGFLIILCLNGYGGPINSFLSLPVFQLISKLSYSMYLFHLIVLSVKYGSMKLPLRFSNVNMMLSFWGDFVLVLVFSAILCLIFESPVIILEKYLLGGRKKPNVTQSSRDHTEAET